MKNVVDVYFDDITPLINQIDKICLENGIEMAGCIFSPVAVPISVPITVFQCGEGKLVNIEATKMSKVFQALHCQLDTGPLLLES